MKKNERAMEAPEDIRRLAEERLEKTLGDSVTIARNLAPEIQRLIHELHVHQIELEMQNEELVRTRTEVAEGLERYTDLYEHSPVGYLSLGPDGEIRQVNLTGARLLGLERSRLVGKRLGLLVTVEDRFAFSEFLTDMIEGRVGKSCDVVIHPEGADPLVVEFTGMPTMDGRECRVVMSDITERWSLQTSKAQSERLASIAMLAAGLAHEINNPLVSVLYNIESLSQDIPRLSTEMKTCLEILRKRFGDELLTDALGSGKNILNPLYIEDMSVRFQDAIEGAERIKLLARRLGSLSRVEQGRIEPVDLPSAAECAISLAASEIKSRARLVKDFEPVPAIMGGEGRLAQVFLNLLINACHSIEAGDVEANEIRIRTWLEGEQVCARVSDTGKGIPRERLEKIFDLSFSAKEPGAGSGLGLPISWNIVTGFGGRIGIQSEVGMGTSVELRFPVRPEDKQGPPEQVDAAGMAKSANRGRILVVDDERSVRSVIERMLALEHEVVTASSGEEARSILTKDQGFDAILCDMMMPVVSGMDLHLWLAEKHPRLAKRLAFITGGASTQNALDYLDKADVFLLEKPFNLKKLEDLVSKLLLASKQNP